MNNNQVSSAENTPAVDNMTATEGFPQNEAANITDTTSDSLFDTLDEAQKAMLSEKLNSIVQKELEARMKSAQETKKAEISEGELVKMVFSRPALLRAIADANARAMVRGTANSPIFSATRSAVPANPKPVPKNIDEATSEARKFFESQK